jgi:hypothetical protein
MDFHGKKKKKKLHEGPWNSMESPFRFQGPLYN